MYLESTPVHQYLVGAVQQREDVPLLHGDLTRTLLLVIVQSQDQLLSGLIISWRYLLLLKKDFESLLLVKK